MRFSIYQESKKGGRKVNQDRMGYLYTRDSLLMLVCDGMGGHARGEVAAQWGMDAVPVVAGGGDNAAGAAGVGVIADGDALLSNWRWLARQGGAPACGAAIKADGYGLGAAVVMQRLKSTGCRDFFVSNWGEAAALEAQMDGVNFAVLHGVRDEDMAQALASQARAAGALRVEHFFHFRCELSDGGLLPIIEPQVASW